MAAYDNHGIVDEDREFPAFPAGVRIVLTAIAVVVLLAMVYFTGAFWISIL